MLEVWSVVFVETEGDVGGRAVSRGGGMFAREGNGLEPRARAPGGGILVKLRQVNGEGFDGSQGGIGEQGRLRRVEQKVESASALVKDRSDPEPVRHRGHAPRWAGAGVAGAVHAGGDDQGTS
jgi:hypothetical protein